MGSWKVSVMGTVAVVLFNLTTSLGREWALYLSLLWQYLGGITMRLSSLFAAHSEQGVYDGLGAGQVRMTIFVSLPLI